MLYDKSVAELMRDASATLVEPMSSGDIIAWFQTNYPRVQVTTIRAHIIGLTSNNQTRRHYPNLAKRKPVFFQVGKGSLVRYDSDLHGSSNALEDPDNENDDLELAEVFKVSESATLAMEFALEMYLEEFIVTNWELIDWGRRLEIWDDGAGQSGHQLNTPVGRLDLLARDVDSDELVVIELKRSKTSDQVVGQAARYIGWVRQHLATPGQTVSGIVIAGEFDDRLRYAASAVPGLSVRAYQVSFALVSADSVGSPME
jgi:RecB family endonuclease NucS